MIPAHENYTIFFFICTNKIISDTYIRQVPYCVSEGLEPFGFLTNSDAFINSGWMLYVYFFKLIYHLILFIRFGFGFP